MKTSPPLTLRLCDKDGCRTQGSEGREGGKRVSGGDKPHPGSGVRSGLRSQIFHVAPSGRRKARHFSEP